METSSVDTGDHRVYAAAVVAGLSENSGTVSVRRVGDGSSLVQLCQKAGKPVMIQDAEIV